MKLFTDIVSAVIVAILTLIFFPFEIIYAGTVSRDTRDGWNRQANKLSGMEE